MASIGGGARKKEPTPRRSSSRGRTVDYKKMHEGSYGEAFKSESESGEHLTETIPPGASLGSAVLPEVEVTLDDYEAAFSQQDDEIARMKNELLCLKRDEQLLLKRKEADELRRLVAEQKKQNTKLRGKSDCVENENESRTGEMSMPGDINIKTLRKSKKLRKKVLKKMGDLGLTDINDKFSSDSESSADESAENLSSKAKSKVSRNKLKKSKKSRAVSSQSDLSSADSESFVDSDSDSSSECTKKSKKGKKSGIKAKASDSVRKQQRYPQAHLRYEFVSSNLSFDKLDLNLFVAGELEIISDQKTREVERMGRLNLLKKIMYLSTSYEFSVLKSLYAACLREIELGKKSWADDFQYIESAILTKHTPKGASGSNSINSGKKSFKNRRHREGQAETEEKFWFCSLYQRNKCSHKASHIQVVKGKARFAQHACASCWQKDGKKLEHPECSSACPYAKL